MGCGDFRTKVETWNLGPVPGHIQSVMDQTVPVRLVGKLSVENAVTV
jgi:hypothetical protein